MDGDAQHPGRTRNVQPVEVAKDERAPLAGRQFVEGGDDAVPDVERFEVEFWQGRLVCDGFLELGIAGGELSAFAVLPAIVIVELVAGDPEEPGDRFIRGKSGVGLDGGEHCLLCQIFGDVDPAPDTRQEIAEDARQGIVEPAIERILLPGSRFGPFGFGNAL